MNNIQDKIYFQRRECPFCYEELSKGALVAFYDGHGRTVCNHSCHSICGYAVNRPNRCPVCKAAYSALGPIPALQVDGRQWFEFMDKDRDGSLHYQELLNGLKEQLVLDWRRVEMDVDRLWPTWDKDRSGKISYEEFAHPTSGVVAYLSANYPERPTPRNDPPDITKNKSTWFDYWDEDRSGNLDRDELTRAFIKTFKLYHIPFQTVLNAVDVLWPMFDFDGSGRIDKREFTMSDGLGDTIVAQLMYEARNS
eukprot:gene7076-7826_t